LRSGGAAIDEGPAAGSSRQKRFGDRRQQWKKIRVGALAFSSAREALRPYGLFVSPKVQSSGFVLPAHAQIRFQIRFQASLNK
jgi:hypothetical protein